MSWDRFRIRINVIAPLAAIGFVLFYHFCGDACSYLQGTLLGVDLAVTGIVFMSALLAVNLPLLARRIPVEHLRTLLLSGALGAEAILLRFQIVHEVFCSFCLAFGGIVILLFIVNFPSMNRYLAAASTAAGVILFHGFFEGTVSVPFF